MGVQEDLDSNLGADLKFHMTPRVEHIGIPGDFAYWPAMPFDALFGPSTDSAIGPFPCGLRVPGPSGYAIIGALWVRGVHDLAQTPYSQQQAFTWWHVVWDLGAPTRLQEASKGHTPCHRVVGGV